MKNGIYYLNNNGSRWVTYVNGEKVTHVFLTNSGGSVKRILQEEYSFGNFTGAVINYKGKRKRVLLDEVLPD